MSYVESLFSLRGRIAVVTGGAGCLAGVIAEAYIKAGASVCIWDRGNGRQPMTETVEKMREKLRESLGPDVAGPSVLAGVTVDVGDRASVESALAETEGLVGVPDILLNGVGGNLGKSSFVDLDEDNFLTILKLNLMAGLVVPTRVFAKYWIERKIEGDVINMTSMTSYKPLSGTFAYGAAKAGTLNLTEALAKELAPHKIRVNAIAPGFFVGNQNRALLMDETTGELTERGKAIIARTPFGRFGDHEELCGVSVFLTSRAASGFVTGVSIPVDGGYLTDNI